MCKRSSVLCLGWSALVEILNACHVAASLSSLFLGKTVIGPQTLTKLFLQFSTSLAVPVFVLEKGCFCFCLFEVAAVQWGKRTCVFEENNPNLLCWRSSSQEVCRAQIVPCVVSHGFWGEKAYEWMWAVQPSAPWLIVGQTSSKAHCALLCVQVWSRCPQGEALFMVVQRDGAVMGRFCAELLQLWRAGSASEPSWADWPATGAEWWSHWAELLQSVAEVSDGSVSRPSWELGIISLSACVKLKMRGSQGTAAKQSLGVWGGGFNTPSMQQGPLSALASIWW